MAEPPSNFKCPITLDVMVDPVIGPDGISYEKSAVTRWLRSNSTLPSRVAATVGQLYPNRGLKANIDEWRQAQAQAGRQSRSSTAAHGSRTAGASPSAQTPATAAAVVPVQGAQEQADIIAALGRERAAAETARLQLQQERVRVERLRKDEATLMIAQARYNMMRGLMNAF